ncbi:Uncharacterized lipoprotein YgeR precursor [Cronobacter turicensis 564]|nr:Uncharacterized lipoprotein YgeR precursor [Cronobacter turicensis 564]
MNTDWPPARTIFNTLCLLFCLFLTACSSNKAGVSDATKGSYSGSVYTVKRGDTLYRISRITGTSVSDLARLNGISAPYTIEVGQRLRVSSTSGSSSSRKTASRQTTPARKTASLAKVDAPPPGQRCWGW